MKIISNDELEKIIGQAQSGNEDAMLKILDLFSYEIYKNSFINNKFDEDCQAVIQEKIILNLKNFKIFY